VVGDRPHPADRSRLAAIASGDFSRHVDVENRDELGALAANVNRTNDELQRSYTELEAESATSRSSWPHVARAANAA
jgi:nitrate/nitrite-specific signal transduction histidine kinase